MPFPRGAGDKAAFRDTAPASSLCGLCSADVDKDEQYIEGELLSRLRGGKQQQLMTL